MSEHATYREKVLALESPIPPEGLVLDAVTTKRLGAAMALLMTGAGAMDFVKRTLYYKKAPDNPEVAAMLDNLTHDLIPKENLHLTREQARLLHGVVGIASESGEMVEMMLDHLTGEELDVTNFLEELGDVEFYQELNLAVLKYTVLQMREANMDKLLKKRYPQGFSVEAAVKRDTAAERTELEKHTKPNG